MQVELAISSRFVGNFILLADNGGIHQAVLISRNRALVAVRRYDQFKASALFRGRKVLLRVFRIDPEPVGSKPDLQQVDGFIGRRIEFTVPDARAGTHALHVPRAYD